MSVGVLRAWLEADSVRGTERRCLETALSAPWLWPEDSDLRTRTQHHGLTRPASPECGEALLISVHGDGSSPVLWKLSRQRGPGIVPFLYDAEESAAIVGYRLCDDLPWLTRDPYLDPVQWCARELVRNPSQPADEHLRGGSFGLSFALAHASVALSSPLPRNLIATGCIDDSGAVHPVEGLRAKLGFIAAEGLGLSEVMVPAAQAREAEDHLALINSALAVIPVGSIREAFQHVFRHSPTTGMSDAQRSLAAFDLAVLTLAGSNRISSWVPVEAAAKSLLMVRGLSDEDAKLLDIACNIASRHLRNEGKLPAIEDPIWDELPDVRGRVLPHVIQAKADMGADDLESAIAVGIEDLGQRPRPTPDRAVLFGAIGRALAVCRDHKGARDYLERAIADWLALDQIGDASRPICALLRVAALKGDRKKVDELEDLSGEVRGLRPRMFARGAVGVARVLLGQPELAQEALGNDKEWLGADEALWVMRTRWLSRALAATNRALADDLRASTLNRDCSDERRLLIELDQVELGTPQSEECAQRILSGRSADAAIARKLVQRVDDSNRARVLRDEFPY